MTKPPEPQLTGLEESVGVWRAVGKLGDYKLRDALWPEAVCGAVLGIGGSALIVSNTSVADRVEYVGDVLQLTGVLLAVTFAALAIVVAIPSGEYLRMLAKTQGVGMRTFLDPYLVAVGGQIAVVLGAFGYRVFADGVAPWIEHVAFGLLGFLFVFILLDVAGLARQLVQHGILRAADAELTEAEREPQSPSPVRQLPERRG